jgi:magnesium transporter
MLTSFLIQKNQPLKSNLSRAEMLAALKIKENVLWLDLEDPSEFETEILIEIFNFHELAIEDCVNALSQPKVDDYGDYLFLVVHGVSLQENKELKIIELDTFLGKNFVVTVHGEPLKSIEQVREIIRRKPEAFSESADMLVHSVLDHAIDHYQPVVTHYEEKIECLEEEVFNSQSKDYLATVMQTKRDLFHFRRIVAPQRDTINHVTRNQTPLIRPENVIYFRDIYDHLFRVYGTIDACSEALNGILHVYFSFSSNKVNEAVKRMTVLATLSMPTVMIASIYGMNFAHMPELNHPYGYFFSLGVMAVTSLGMLAFMKFKKWI